MLNLVEEHAGDELALGVRRQSLELRERVVVAIAAVGEHESLEARIIATGVAQIAGHEGAVVRRAGDTRHHGQRTGACGQRRIAQTSGAEQAIGTAEINIAPGQHIELPRAVEFETRLIDL